MLVPVEIAVAIPPVAALSSRTEKSVEYVMQLVSSTIVVKIPMFVSEAEAVAMEKVRKLNEDVVLSSKLRRRYLVKSLY